MLKAVAETRALLHPSNNSFCCYLAALHTSWQNVKKKKFNLLTRVTWITRRYMHAYIDARSHAQTIKNHHTHQNSIAHGCVFEKFIVFYNACVCVFILQNFQITFVMLCFFLILFCHRLLSLKGFFLPSFIQSILVFFSYKFCCLRFYFLYLKCLNKYYLQHSYARA